MTETDRSLVTKTVIFQQEFIRHYYFGCFASHCYVVVKNRNFLIYANKNQYSLQPQRPEWFFNISHISLTLGKDDLKVSNSFAEIVLRHRDNFQIVELMCAVQNARATMSPTTLYPQKFKLLERQALQIQPPVK